MSTEFPALTALLKQQFPDDVLDCHQHRGDETVSIKPDRSLEILTFLRDHESSLFDMLMDLSAVDYLPRDPRFEVVYHLYSVPFNHRLRIKVPLTETATSVASVHELWLCADWYERECYDMYGIQFEGHPDLRRILMYDSFEGYPLRKDYPIDRAQPLMELRNIEERYSYERN